MDTVVVLLFGIGLVFAILGGVLLVARRNKVRVPPLEPPPDAPAIPKEVRDDVARRKLDFERRLAEEEHAAREEAGLGKVEDKLERKRRRQGDRPPISPDAADL